MRDGRAAKRELLAFLIGFLLIAPAITRADESAANPTLFIVGDSTVKNGTRDQVGLEMARREQARAQAIMALPEIAREVLTDRKRRGVGL